MPSEQINGFVLHRRPYRETSYLVDLFTLEWGKIRAIVKGVRATKSDKRSALQAFQPLLLTLSGRHELKNLSQLETTAPMLPLAGKSLFSAMYINEVLNRLLAAEIPHPELYIRYQECLRLLAHNPEIEPTLRQFELGLLDDLGYGLELNQEYQHGKPLDPDSFYTFIHEHGLQRVVQQNPSTNSFKGAILLQVSQLDWNHSSLNCAKQITRLALFQLLGSKPLKSRELFRYS
ncbi:MAG: DNA repair protein RecO (recombination protein O) [Paraglaciecola sp.]